jgi:hypothetical protein
MHGYINRSRLPHSDPFSRRDPFGREKPATELFIVTLNISKIFLKSQSNTKNPQNKKY